MQIKTFLKLVEIQTKIASVFPFVMGILFTFYRFGEIKILNTFIFFIAMILFDLTTTTINNYMDFKKATDQHDYDYRKQSNVIGQENIPEKTVVTLIFLMLTMATILGLVLVVRTNVFLLFVGMLCFGIGVFYTFGPVPLSRMPLGEIFSGVTMGFGIFFISMYVNVYDLSILSFQIEDGFFLLKGNIEELLVMVLVSLPGIFTIANLMMANNICDLDEDILNHRYTLPYYIGKQTAVKLFNLLYILSFLSVIVAVLIGVFHPLMLVSLVAMIPVYKNLKLFNQKQVKSETFVLSVKNLIIINSIECFVLLISLFFK
ncbi:1,4-dihydroxy-2-naphthoate polyprenyltransferase [Isobaculum melis]|uniref:1,4-dihydroxy-2-naphthoate polyprenyltransferase n=1 Tax=Isobaculum melis TaxID=142588 RepID=UPI000B8831D0|nr:1,4-dihydroxy-2-naphthoate polyprenyltransferase [Isobaculum melis]